MSVDFEELLLSHAAPRLRLLDYEYDARLRLDDELYGFRRDLGDDVRAIVQFQYDWEAEQHSFTVNLVTAKSSEIQPRVFGGYPGARGARLSYVMWYVYGRRDYTAPDYWWVARDEGDLASAVHEALGHIERCGIPWLERADAPRPWEMPARRAIEFDEAVQAVLARELEHLGYRLMRQSLRGDLPYCYFSKAMPDGTFALIEMQPIYSLDPAEFSFDVRLQRRTGDDPLAVNSQDDQQRSASLAQLAWQARVGAPLDQLSISQVKTLFWHYRDRAELDTQLSDALQQIRQVGITWIEQPAAPSKMIQ
jgi:hypothetical protein